MGWHCVHIEHMRLSNALNVTFRNMLLAEYRSLGTPADCRVYRRRHPDAAITYYFSPNAFESMSAFVEFWNGYACPEPTDFIGLEVII